MEEKGIYYFHQGTNYYAYELLGAHYSEKETVFRVWAPNAKEVSVIGDFNDWDIFKNKMTRISNEGIWEVAIQNVKEYDCYQYAILTNDNNWINKADPYAFHSELRPNRASRVYNLNNYEFNDDEWMKNRALKQANYQPINIYEIHLGSWKRYSDGNVFNYRKIGEEVSKYAKKMGYTHIEVMPISEYPYDPSWGYQVTGFYAITSRYGTPADFMDFVNTCHHNGIGVIVDWVPGHFGKDGHGLIDFDGNHLYEHPDPLRMEHQGWGTRCFDYGRTEIQSFLTSNAMFYFDKFHIDGLRVDAVASMLYLDYDRHGETAKNSFGGNTNLEAVAFLQKTNTVVHEHFPGVLMIAEESTAYPGVTKSPTEGGLGFDYKWNMGWMNDTLSYVKTDPIYKSYDHHKITFQMSYIYSEQYILPLSHDEVVHGKKSLLDKMSGDEWQRFASLRLLYSYYMVHPGKKLLFMGSEFGQGLEWRYAYGLEWELLEREQHIKMKDFVRDLNYLYKDEKSLYEIDNSYEGFDFIDPHNEEQSIVTLMRKGKDEDEFLICVLNFTPVVHYDYNVGVPYLGEYEEIFNSDDEKYWGSNQTMKKDTLHAIDEKWHNKPYHIRIKVPPLGATFIKMKKRYKGNV